MSEQKNDIEKLIRLKRYEKPSDDYFDNFLAEFQSRQRSELLQRSARSLLFERVSTYFSEISRRQWVLTSSAAYAAVAVGLFVFLSSGDSEPRDPSTQAPTFANVSETSADRGTSLWEEWKEPRIVLVEDDPQQILDRQGSMTLNAEWDPNVLPTSSRGANSQLVPVKGGEGSPEAKPVSRPAGLEL